MVVLYVQDINNEIINGPSKNRSMLQFLFNPKPNMRILGTPSPHIVLSQLNREENLCLAIEAKIYVLILNMGDQSMQMMINQVHPRCQVLLVPAQIPADYLQLASLMLSKHQHRSQLQVALILTGIRKVRMSVLGRYMTCQEQKDRNQTLAHLNQHPLTYPKYSTHSYMQIALTQILKLLHSLPCPALPLLAELPERRPRKMKCWQAASTIPSTRNLC